MRREQPQGEGHHAASFAVVLLTTAAFANISDILLQAVPGWPTAWGGLSRIGQALLIPLVPLVLAALVRTRPGLTLRFVGLPTVIAFVVLITAANVSSHDGSLAAQLSMLLPVLYSSYQLERVPATIAAAASAVGTTVSAVQAVGLMEGLRDGLYAAMLFGAATYVIQVLRNSQERALHALDTLANTDNLTGLANRAALSNLDTAALAAAGTAVMVLDVDDFKVINDTYGHPAGDETLMQIAQVVRQACRAGDHAFRLGGDEILILMPGATAQAARSRATHLQETLRQRPIPMGQHEPIVVSISIGVASSVGHPAMGMEDLYHAADADLYQWKSRRRAARGGATRSSAPRTHQIEA